MDNFEFKVEDCSSLKVDLLKNVYEKRNIVYGKLYKFEKVNHLKHSFLYVSYCKNLETDNFIVTIKGSIRKWYLGKNSFNDLTENEFEDCLNLIAHRLGIVNEEFWNCKIQKLEISLTIKLKAKYRHILKSFVYYSNFDRSTYGTNSLAFKGDAYGVKLYDTIEKTLSTKRIIKEINHKLIEKKIRRKTINLIKNKAFFVRCELDVNKIYKMKSTLKNLINSPIEIKNNWNKIYHEFKDMICSITCLSLNDEFGNEISLSAIRRKLELGEISIREFDRLVLIHMLGFDNYYEDINLLSNDTTKNRQREQLKKLLEVKMTKCDDLNVLIKGFDKALSKTEL